VCSDAEKDRRRTHRRGKTPRISPQFLLHNPRKNERVEVADQKLDFFNGLLELKFARMRASVASAAMANPRLL
jgi:hypothetical protein